MIYWFDSFMAIFGFKRPEVWEAERKEHDVTFPAPHAFKEPRKRSNVRSKKAGKRSQSAEGSANVRSRRSIARNRMQCPCTECLKQAGKLPQKADSRGENKGLQEMVHAIHARMANVRSKPLTLSELRKDSGKCHAIYQMVDAFTDEQIAKEIGATVRAVQDYRLLVGWRRR